MARILYATNRFPDGIAVVLCNEQSDPVTVLKAVLTRFDPQRREPAETELADLRDLAKQVFAGRRALVMLDNVEPDWPVEQVVAPLRAAGATVLLTSRQRLPASAVPQEAGRMLELLAPDEAVDLFAEYLGRGTKLDLTLSEQDAAGRIVKALGYHTLAVKLAAARAQGRDLRRLAAEYEADPRLGVHLKDGTEAVEIVLASSVASLPSGAQRLFDALAAFATADIGRQATLAVAGTLDDPTPGESLDAIVDLRLVDRYVNDLLPAESDNERLRLHPLVRAYAGQRLATWSDDGQEAARRAVAEWYDRYTNEQPKSRRHGLSADEENILGALEWALAQPDDRLVAGIARGMAYFWRDTGRVKTGRAYLRHGIESAQRVADRTGDRDDRIRHAALLAAMGISSKTADCWRRRNNNTKRA